MTVGVGADAHHVDLGPAVQERPEEAGGVGEGSARVGVATDAEDFPDADGVYPFDDPSDVVLALDHPGCEVRDDGEALLGVPGAQIEGVVDGLGRRAGHRHGCPVR